MKISLLRPTVILLSAIALMATPRPVNADTIDWGFDAPFTTSLDSGASALDASYVFHVGAFNALGTFTPTRANIADWSTNWQSFDTDTYNAGTAFFHGNQSINDNSVFPATEQAYIWGTNNGISSSGEFVLLTSASWQFPTATAADTSTTSFLLTNGGTDTGVSAIVGAIDNTYSGSETGISVDATGSNFDLQTEAVPEPASALFFSISAIWFLFRRPRRVTT